MNVEPLAIEIAGDGDEIRLEPVRAVDPARDAPAARERPAVQVRDLDDAIAVERLGQPFDFDVAAADARTLVERQARADGRCQQGREQRGSRRRAEDVREREREGGGEAEQPRERPPDEERPQHEVEARPAWGRPCRPATHEAQQEPDREQGGDRDHRRDAAHEVRQHRHQRNLQADRQQHDHHEETGRAAASGRARALIRRSHAELCDGRAASATGAFVTAALNLARPRPPPSAVAPPRAERSAVAGAAGIPATSARVATAGWSGSDPAWSA